MSNLHEAEQYLSAAWELSQAAVVADHLGQVYEQEQKPEAAIRMYRLALAANPGLPETQERLKRFAPAKTKPESYSQGGADLSEMRTTKLTRMATGPASAEFFLLFAPGPKLEDVKFISGSEKLKTASKTLTAATFRVPFPSSSNARLVRRGVLGCYPTTGCALVLLTPSLVRSVN